MPMLAHTGLIPRINAQASPQREIQMPPLLHVSFNPIRLKDKNMQQIKVLQRPLRV
ncbi:hypothetical protein GOB46_16430 [Sinorhizobium meliloti]|nr:hypothetical protein [Sinorhizobium meliloti]MDW9872356.1 hypothetical protein [Sinorhizobium meliloti]MDW9885336.1 hypothetical protein [Sinorhizobium meliloti]MDX0207381.1 hypothetical protein [Sinorhizobium meliloti]